jgi:hypothetical protein
MYFLLFKKIELKIINKNEDIYKSSLALPFHKYPCPDVCFSTQSYMRLFNIFQQLSGKARNHHHMQDSTVPSTFGIKLKSYKINLHKIIGIWKLSISKSAKPCHKLNTTKPH